MEREPALLARATELGPQSFPKVFIRIPIRCVHFLKLYFENYPTWIRVWVKGPKAVFKAVLEDSDMENSA